MTKLKAALIFAASLVFAMVVVWGIKYQRDLAEASKKIIVPNRTIRVLTFKNVIPNDVRDLFKSEARANVEIIEIATPDELEAAWAKYRPDVVTPFSYQTREFLLRSRLEPVARRKIAGISNISNDFLSTNEMLAGLPVLWGVEGLVAAKTKKLEPGLAWADVFHADSLKQKLKVKLKPNKAEVRRWIELNPNWKNKNTDALSETAPAIFAEAPKASAEGEPPVPETSDVLQLNLAECEQTLCKADYQFLHPKERSLLWTLNFSISATAASKDLAEQFLEFAIRPDVAKRLALSSRQASTLQSLNQDAELSEPQKASALRTIPLTDIVNYQPEPASTPAAE